MYNIIIIITQIIILGIPAMDYRLKNLKCQILISMKSHGHADHEKSAAAWKMD